MYTPTGITLAYYPGESIVKKKYIRDDIPLCGVGGGPGEELEHPSY